MIVIASPNDESLARDGREGEGVDEDTADNDRPDGGRGGGGDDGNYRRAESHDECILILCPSPPTEMSPMIIYMMAGQHPRWMEEEG